MCSMGNEDTLYKNPEPISIDHTCIGNISPPQMSVVRNVEILRNLTIFQRKSGIQHSMHSRSEIANGTTSGKIKICSDFILNLCFSVLYIEFEIFTHA